MRDKSNVIPLRSRSKDGKDENGNIVCRDCGSQWFKANICLDADMSVAAINDLRCHYCEAAHDLGGNR